MRTLEIACPFPHAGYQIGDFLFEGSGNLRYSILPAQDNLFIPIVDAAHLFFFGVVRRHGL